MLSKLDATEGKIVPLKATVKKLQEDIAKAVQERDIAVQVTLSFMTTSIADIVLHDVSVILLIVQCKHAIRTLVCCHSL